MESKLETQNVTSDEVEEEAEESDIYIRVFVARLKTLLDEKYPDLRLPPDGDNILIRCLRHRKFDVTQAADQVHSFFRLFYDLNQMREENIFVPSSHKAYFLDSFSFGFLKHRDSKGTPVYFVNHETMPGATYCLAKGLSVLVMMLNEVTRPLVDRKMGVINVINLKGFQFAHAKHYTPSRLHAVAKLVQGAIPVSFKSFYCINTPTLFLAVYALLKPLLRQKIKDRVHFFGSDLTEFYKVFDKSVLPVALEGDLPNEEGVDTDFNNELCQQDEYYEEFLRYGYFRPLNQRT